jgi:arginyl-tRNA--protein-N-Asp/Glu arginylyltransferase
MFIRQNIQTLRFFRTTPAMRCPYLPHRLETKLVTELSGPDAISQHDTLTDAGFRRSHHFVYKPLCEGCRSSIAGPRSASCGAMNMFMPWKPRRWRPASSTRYFHAM